MSTDTVWDIPGQQRVAEVLAGACARGEVSHALAFVGPSGVGQEHAAHALTAALNCPTPRSDAPGEPCGHCSVCERSMRGSFSAYQEFLPSGGLHRVDDVRDSWLHAASVSIGEGTWKILRIVDADRMNDSAANAFLKGLEEPPERTVWILDIADPDELPDTILSRCRELRFAPWAPPELDAHARALGIDDAAERAIAVRIASGAPAVLSRLARPGVPARSEKKPALPSGMDDVRRHGAILQGLRAGGPGFALTAAHAIEEEVKREVTRIEDEGAAKLAELGSRFGEELPASLEKQHKERVARQAREAKVATAQAALDDLVGWCRDVLLIACGGDPADVLHLGAQEALRADADALGAAGVLQVIDLALATREHLEHNVQIKVALEALFLDLSTLTLAPIGR